MCGIGVVFGKDEGTHRKLLDAMIQAMEKRGPDNLNTFQSSHSDPLTFVGAVLHIQGDQIFQQPVIDEVSGNVLLWNGEVFGGELEIPVGVADTSVVMNSLCSLSLVMEDDKKVSSEKIMSILSKIQGPYAFIFYCAAQRRLYYGRDPFGRRSLVTAVLDGKLQTISSTCYPNISNFEWEEVSISGIYAVDIISSVTPVAELELCPWPSSTLRLNRPIQDLDHIEPLTTSTLSRLSSQFLDLVKRSLYKRIIKLSPSFQIQTELTSSEQRCFVGVLFSGGIDSLLLAAMLHLSMLDNISAPIELINIAFDFRDQQGKPSAAPDRLAGIAGMFALQRLFPERQWRFIEVDVTQAEREEAEVSIKGLIQPLATHMDLNIGTAFWFASRGQGVLKVYDPAAEEILYQQTNEEDRPLLRLGEEGALKGVGRSIPVVEDVPKIAEIADMDDETTPDVVQIGVTEEDTSLEKKAPHWCRMSACKRPTKRNCPGHLCGRCCEEKMENDSSYKCKIHSKGKSKREGTSATSAAPKASSAEGEGDGDGCVNFDYRLLPIQSTQPYRAQCKALLVGIGADEQLAGYGRHRTVFQHGGYSALQQELNKDLTRLWQRNLGRDDRCIADHGREAWFPYLDEELVGFIQSQQLSHLINLSLSPGVGDKQVLRLAAAQIGLEKSAQLVKRAIQFGSLASKQTSVSYFGSRRKGKGTSTI